MRLHILLSGFALVSAVTLPAQIAPPSGHWEYVRVCSGRHDNPFPIENVVWRDFVALSPSVPWLRLTFAGAALDKGSYLRIVSLVDGDYHDVDSSERAFFTAASIAFKEAFKKANPALIEPIMSVSVITPAEYLGPVNGDLAARRGRIEAMDEKSNGTREIRAMVPLSKMFGYSTQVRTISSGKATFTMTFDHYEPVPFSTAEEIIAERVKSGIIGGRQGTNA